MECQTEDRVRPVGDPSKQLREGLRDLGIIRRRGGHLEDDVVELAAHKASVCCFMLGCRSRYVRRCQETLAAAQLVRVARAQDLKRQRVSILEEDALDEPMLAETEDIPSNTNHQRGLWGGAAQRASRWLCHAVETAQKVEHLIQAHINDDDAHEGLYDPLPSQWKRVFPRSLLSFSSEEELH